MKKLFLLLTAVAFGYVNSNAQTKVLFVHNSPDPALAVVDVWIESAAGYSNYADDLEYQQGFFLSVPVTIPGAATIHIKDAASSSSGDPDIFTKPLAALPTGENVAIASGFLTPALISGKTNPDGVSNAFDLTLQAATLTSSDPNKVSVFFHQGVVDLASTYFQS